MQKLLIAETNVSGTIEWVWIGTGRAVRPLTPAGAAKIRVDDAVVSGARREAVQRWLRDCAEGSLAPTR